MNTVASILASAGGLSIVSTAIMAILFRRWVKAREVKSGVDAVAVLSQTATELLDPLREELKEARQDLRDTRTEMAALRRHLIVMEGLLNKAGIPVPEFVWPPAGNGTKGGSFR